jgi:Glycosyltransferase WbsX
MGRTTSLTWNQYEKLLLDWCGRFGSRSNYWRIDNRPVFSINNLADFVSVYGNATFAVMLRYAAKIIYSEIGVMPYMLGVIGESNLRNVRLVNSLPIDGVTGYGLLPNWLGNPVQEYGVLIRERVHEWEEVQSRINIPFYPVVCAGWDATLRGNFRGTLRADDGYPYSPVVVGVTVELFANFIDRALVFNQRWHPHQNLVFFHAWNEWTEGSVLEPSDQYGNTFLDEIRKRNIEGYLFDETLKQDAFGSGLL